MSQSAEAAEQIVNAATNATIKGVECVSNLAGKGAMSLATFLLAVIKEEKKTKGKARMRAFNGKPTKVFVIKKKDMETFAEEAKKYGVLYAAVYSKKQKDGLVDVVVNAADAAKVNRIAERFALSTVDVEKIRENAKFEVSRIREIEEQTRHDVVAFTRAVSESLG
ncbi:MAG: PcfB family protein, partial [Clostridia bacterium]|nr:PcfB family protein [Clostridia bacterium]